jgi:hypothetical protein
MIGLNGMGCGVLACRVVFRKEKKKGRRRIA